ncbi:sphingolipid ceramide N-deacylase [Gordonia alkaliphila]|uniref:sphingolipid ceramide N-deacylase n=1 Tax=Gordonia alkaliphila TaxID=1053547 RepID=UPI0031EA5F49
MVSVITVLVAASVPGALTGPAQAEPTGSPAYSLAGKCYQLTGPKVPAGKYYAKAADLGQFLFYDTAGRVLTAAGKTVAAQHQLSNDAIWSVRATGDGYRMTSTTQRSTARTVALTPAQGCRTFPEAQLNVDGGPTPGVNAQGELTGFVDGHAHLMAEQFLGGGIHCGKPYSPLGITVALKDCADHGTDGMPALLEHVLSKPGPHSSDGWPTFEGWPKWYSLTHEQTYYRWVERAWRGGVRLINNYYVQNRVLCELYPLGDETCDEMESVRVQHRRLNKLIDYIDAQAGGPGKGFMRIVRSAAEARAVIASGKLAVSLGIEISEPFGCRIINNVPQCDKGDIDRGMDELKAMGVRQMILTHKFDNALGGSRIDSDLTGAAVGIGQVLATAVPWQTEPCRTPLRDNQAPLDGPDRCNAMGLTALGAYAVEGAIKRNMMIDVDHLSVKSLNRVLQIAEAHKYPGVTSTHSWTDKSVYNRILALGGTVGLYGGAPEDFVQDWRTLRSHLKSGAAPLGLSFGADTNGLGTQGSPRENAAADPVRYPYRSENGTLMYRQVSGTKSFDVNVDGNAHYGLIPDWIQSMRLEAGAQGDTLVADMYRAANSKVDQWATVESYQR